MPYSWWNQWWEWITLIHLVINFLIDGSQFMSALLVWKVWYYRMAKVITKFSKIKGAHADIIERTFVFTYRILRPRGLLLLIITLILYLLFANFLMPLKLLLSIISWGIRIVRKNPNWILLFYATRQCAIAIILPGSVSWLMWNNDWRVIYLLFFNYASLFLDISIFLPFYRFFTRIGAKLSII